ncbi:MAG: hypothetical protein AB7D36_00805 [Oscillospiraceae bacterium]
MILSVAAEKRIKSALQQSFALLWIGTALAASVHAPGNDRFEFIFTVRGENSARLLTAAGNA